MRSFRRRDPVRDTLGFISKGTLGFFIVIVCHFKTAEANSWKTRSFLESLRETDLNFRFIENGLNSVHSIDFGESVVNQYRPLLNAMLVSDTMDDGAGRIRRLNELSSEDVGTLSHEAFHAFKANFLDRGRQYSDDREFIRIRADAVFGDLPKSKRYVALEEAYATFIGWMVTNTVSLRGMMKRMRNGSCDRRMKTFRDIWRVGWTQEVKGYYYRDGIGEYWADKAHSLWVLLSEGRESYEDLIGSDRAIFSETTLRDFDKKWIAMRFFENRISKDFDRTFSREISECVDGPDFDQ